MQINLNTDCAIRVLLSLSDAGCSVTINNIKQRTDISTYNIDSVILKLMDRKKVYHNPNKQVQHNLIINPDKVTLIIIQAADDVTQIEFKPDKNPNMSLSNIVFSALDKNS